MTSPAANSPIRPQHRCHLAASAVALCGWLAAAPAGAQTTLGTPVESTDVVEEEAVENRPDDATRIVARSAAEEHEARAEAVAVVDTKEDRARSGDMASVLKRQTGVAVRQAGGLGSQSRLSLNGLSGDQVRIFVDGIPLEMAGYGFSLAQVPVNLSKRVEIYRGVVPVRLGADALGGAVNLVTRQRLRSSSIAGSAQVGSFGTLRATLAARYAAPEVGLSAGLSIFHDLAENNYLVDVEQPDALGRPQQIRVPRFHDAYRATGVSGDVALTDQAFADVLHLRLYAASSYKQIAHNAVMTVPYGEPEVDLADLGTTLRYEVSDLLVPGSTVNLVSAVSRRTIRFRDLGTWTYNWEGERIRERPRGGEIGTTPVETVLFDDNVFSRLVVAQNLFAGQAIRASVTVRGATRTGQDQLSPVDVRDPMSAERLFASTVLGLEHELALFDDKLKHVIFAKGYGYLARTEEQLPGAVFRRHDTSYFEPGAGSAVRYAPFDGVALKASYEYATRLPRPDEIFGDGVLVLPNLQLRPERSHNVNLGWQVRTPGSWWGNLKLEANTFLRDADELIVLLSNQNFAQYQNVFGARSLGVEASGEWRTLGDRLRIAANGTWLEQRNVSDEGTFGLFAGDRIPNRPWLFANLMWSFRERSLLLDDDNATLYWTTSYVHEFYRGWESQGFAQFKQTVDSQFTHNVGASYAFPDVGISLSCEMQNLTNAKAFDFFGVQRPGRSVFVKVVIEP